MTTHNKIKKCCKHFTLLLFLSSVRETQASIFPTVWKETIKNQELKTSELKKSDEFSENIDTQKKRNRYKSVYQKNNIDRFTSTPAYRDLLKRLSVNNEILCKKILEKRIKERKEKIKENTRMIETVNIRLKRLIEDYKKMIKKQKA